MAKDMPIGEEMAGVDAATFESLEKDFQSVLEELVGDQSLSKFREEYEKLHRALRKSHDNEKRLIKKCRELNSEIVSNAAKVQTALKLSEEDQGTIAALKKEIEKAWKLVDASPEKEARAKETIQQLKLEIANLTRLLEQGAGLSLGQESTVNDLMTEKDELTKERDGQVTQIVSLRTEVMELSERLRAEEASKLGLETDVASLKEQVAAKKAEGEREARKKDRLEKEIRDLKGHLEQRAQELKSKQGMVTQSEEHVARLEMMLKEQNSSTNKAKKEYNGLVEKVEKLHVELDEQLHANQQLVSENHQKQVELKVKEDEISSVRAEAVKTNRVREATLQKLRAVEKQKTEVEHSRDSLKSEITQLEREMEVVRKNLEVEKKKEDELLRERDILNKLRTRAEDATQRQMDLVKINDNAKKNLEQEITGFKLEAQRQSKQIYSLEKEREKYGAEASEATAKYMSALEEVKLREMAIIDLQKKIAEGENRLKQQQNLYEAVRSDRNLYSKNLIEAQDEIAEMKRKFKICNHQIEQLKEEISAKDLALVRVHFDHMKVEKEKESLRFELQKAKSQVGEAESTISGQGSEIEKLNHIINEADAERLRQRKEYDIVINERDILGTQLIRRNDELALLYEKIKIQQSSLNKGQIQYRDRLNEIRVLNIKLADLRRELSILKNSVSNIDVLKREVHHLGRELLQERTKVKALSEELENPLNVHRWRKLEGSDPSTYELISKVHSLQKRLISKTEEVVEKDLLIQEKEKLYVELKNILARQPGPEVAEQLMVYQQTLREKTSQLKSMASELNTYQATVNEYKYEMERINRELADIKRRYYEKKRKEAADREKAVNTGEFGKGPPSGSFQPRFTGGGFSLAS